MMVESPMEHFVQPQNVPGDIQRFDLMGLKPPRSSPSTVPADHPQLWCGKHVNNTTVLKNVYNYASAKDGAEKTPMCRIAELARFHKLKHEYVLLDESGPAHKKRFTVKLVLCEGQQFEGSGASIKKAQQSAAEEALAKTTLARPHPKNRKPKKDLSNPVNLLYSVAGQLGIDVQYREETPAPPRQPTCAPPRSASLMQSLCTGQYRQPYAPVHPPPLSLPTPPPLWNNGFYQHVPQPLLGQPPPHPQAPQQFSRPPPVLPPKAGYVCPGQQPPNYNRFAGVSQVYPPAMVAANGMPMPLPPVGYNSFPPALSNVPSVPPPAIQPPVQVKREFKAVAVLSDGTEHAGIGPRISIAKANAATKALRHLGPALAELEAKLLKKEAADVCDSSILEKENVSDGDSTPDPSPDIASEDGRSRNASENDDTGVYSDERSDDADSDEKSEQPVASAKRKKPKSVISQIHEHALRLKMNVEFEVIMESGEPHNRRYLLRCRLCSPTHEHVIVADGEGTSKKAAKQHACQKMLEQVKGMVDLKLIPEADPLYLASQIVKSTAKKGAYSNGNKENKRKTIVKDMKRDPQYGHHINPISRLIQVMQASKQPEPVFNLIAEQGQNRYKEFVVEVTCQGNREEGTGPNKRLAKRAAAEAMLARIGYVKPMPQPGKSLLKKRSSDSITDMSSPTQNQVDIGVFDMTEFLDGVDEKPESPERPVSPEPVGNPLSLETFADVENSFVDTTSPREEEPARSVKASVSINSEMSDTLPNGTDSDLQPIRSSRRRVTFSNQVSACPPPDDSNYPEESITPLKSEVVVVSKLKKRGRDSKKTLTPEERQVVAAAARFFLSYPLSETTQSGFVTNDPPIVSMVFDAAALPAKDVPTFSVRIAKECLEKLAKTHKFTVVYSDFPKNAMDDQNFSLVTLGFDKPIVCHGGGKDEEDAHNMAAFNAIKSLAGLCLASAESVPIQP